MNILITRTDRLGDLVQSLAAVRSLKKNLPGDRIGFLVAKANVPILQDNPAIDTIHCIEETDGETLGREGYDAVVVLWYDKRVIRIVRAAGIPLRVGPLSKPGSFFVFNRGVRQHRSASVKNEAEYNADLIRVLCPTAVAERPVIFNHGVAPAFALPERYVVIAPQSRNSAPNLSDELYRRIAAAIRERGVPIVVCGTGQDALSGRIAMECNGIDTCGRTTLEELLFVISRSLFVVAPSTGTLHLANGLGRPILSFYPPSRTVSAVRWAPFGYEGKIFTSAYDCTKKCRTDRECSNRCMEFEFGEIGRAIDRLIADSHLQGPGDRP